MLLKILKTISKILNRPILFTFRRITYYAQPSGSTIETIPTNGNIRGHRAKFVNYFDDSYIDINEINEILKPYPTKGE